MLIAPRTSTPKEVWCYWGSTGVGKTRKCFEDFPNAYWKTRDPGQAQYWDGYDGEETIIIDEFYGWFPWDFLLRLTDRYPLNLAVKGSTVPSLASKIVFTSNKHPRDWYPNSRYQWDDTNPLRRRFGDNIIELTGDQSNSELRQSSSLAQPGGTMPGGMDQPRSINDVLGRRTNDERPHGKPNPGVPVFRNGLPAPILIDDDEM